MNSIEFILGEDKKIMVSVFSTKGDFFTISSAGFELLKNNELQTSGACEVNAHDLIFQIKPTERVTYTLMITYEIAEEVFKTRYALSVV